MLDTPPDSPAPDPVAPYVNPHSSSRHHRYQWFVGILAVIVLISLGVFAWQGHFISLNPTPTPTPATATDQTELESSLQAADTALGDLNANLINTSTVLADQAGDLAE